MDLQYVEELMNQLTELGKVEKQLTKAKQQKDIIREKVRNWLDMHNLDEYETFDSKGNELWRMTIKSTSRKSAKIDVLENLLSEELFNEAVSIVEYNVFKIQPVKNKKSKSKSKPRAPKAT
jgi:hypothetical protein